jgi:probable F420-dependent oxidoreductase
VEDGELAMKNRRYWGTLSGNFPAELLVPMARQQEEMGMEGIFAPQVYGPPFIPLAAAAAVTQRVKLASGIALAFVRSPFETAMAAMDLDRLSGGRFILGLGTSVRSWSEGFFGMPYERPLGRLREVVAILRAVFEKAHTGELKEFKGRYYTLDLREFQPLAQPLRTDIPIWIAALRQPLVRLGAEIADGVIGHPIWSVRWAATEAQQALKEGLARAQKSRSDVNLNLWFFVAPNKDRRQSLEDARATVAFYGGAAQYEEYFAAHGFRDEARKLQAGVQAGDYLGVARLVPDEMAETFVVCGTPDEVRKKLEPAWEAADSLCLNPPVYGLSPQAVMGYTAAIAETFYA